MCIYTLYIYVCVCVCVYLMSVNFFGLLIDQVCLPYHMFAKLGCTQCSAKEKSSPTVMLSLRLFMDKVTQERPLKMSNSQKSILSRENEVALYYTLYEYFQSSVSHFYIQRHIKRYALR